MLKVKKGEFVALDVETYGQPDGKIHRPNGTFACLSVATKTQTLQIYDPKEVKGVLRACKDGIWVFHNALYDLTQLRRFAEIPPRFIWDVMLVDQSMCGGLYQKYSLADLSRRWLNKRMRKDVRKDFSSADSMTKKMKDYALGDAVDTLKIAELQHKEYADTLAFNAYLKIDEPCIFPFLDMQGVPVDVDAWKKMAERFQAQANELEAELGLNVQSSAQVIVAAKKQGIHLANAKASSLEEFMDSPWIEKVLLAKRYRKAASTYGIKWLDNVEEDGKVYSSYHITGTETGRKSSSNPNMQNIPARKLPEYRLRFVAQKDHVMVISDVNQQEPRITAWESKDEELIREIKNGVSTHLVVARTIYGNPKLTKKDAEEYANGKIVNLGVTYGMKKHKLARSLKTTEEIAERFLQQYFTRFRGVLSWISMQRMAARRDGFVKTAVGRRIYLNPYHHSFENNAINAPIQGGAADFTKMWSRKIWELSQKNGIPYYVCLDVHDELGAHVYRPHLKKYLKIKDEAFQMTAKSLYPGVPFEEETEVGRSWGVKQNREEAVVFDEDDE